MAVRRSPARAFGPDLLRAAGLGLCLALLALSACTPLYQAPKGLEYRLITRSSPRPLRIHVVAVDLDAASARFAVKVGPDPDGSGPAEAELRDPLTVAERGGSLALINANAFAPLVGDADQEKPLWYAGRPVAIAGWAVEDGVERHAFEPGYGAVWSAADGSVLIGASEPPGGSAEAAAGFRVIASGGLVQVAAGGELHPRSGIGVDATGRRLWLVVVDGRQAGYSEGMTEAELAQEMLALGAVDALNLDGGGSSALVISCPDGLHRVVNAPSDLPPVLGLRRPLPVMIAIETR